MSKRIFLMRKMNYPMKKVDYLMGKAAYSVRKAIILQRPLGRYVRESWQFYARVRQLGYPRRFHRRPHRVADFAPKIT